MARWDTPAGRSDTKKMPNSMTRRPETNTGRSFANPSKVLGDGETGATGLNQWYHWRNRRLEESAPFSNRIVWRAVFWWKFYLEE
jgi:hypothetical protein